MLNLNLPYDLSIAIEEGLNLGYDVKSENCAGCNLGENNYLYLDYNMS